MARAGADNGRWSSDGDFVSEVTVTDSTEMSGSVAGGGDTLCVASTWSVESVCLASICDKRLCGIHRSAMNLCLFVWGGGVS